MNKELEKLDYELRFILFITRKLPRIKGMIRIGKIFSNFYLRKKRKEVVINVFDFKMRLAPNESFSNSTCLFYPQLYDFREVEFLNKNLKSRGVFIDIGAHIGFYSLIASSLIGKEGKVLTIEATPDTYQRLVYNIKLNSIENIIPVSAGVSDKIETLRLSINKEQQGKNSFLEWQPEGVNVQCFPLNDILQKNSIDKIGGLKIDIEGFEYKVLSHFFRFASNNLHPKFIIIEYKKEIAEKTGKDVLRLLQKYGYQENFHSGPNYIMVKT